MSGKHRKGKAKNRSSAQPIHASRTIQRTQHETVQQFTRKVLKVLGFKHRSQSRY